MTTVLIVDDDAVDRQMVRRNLRFVQGLSFLEARDGEEALVLVGEHSPEIVLTDLRMPKMDGLALVRRLRDDHPSIVPVLLTSQGSEQIAAEALRAGAMDYVPKNMAREGLAEAMFRALQLISVRRARGRLLQYLQHSESYFELENDPSLIAPLASYFHDALAQIGCCDAAARSQAGVAVVEALSNAMIHGNLELSSELRRQSREVYDREIERRRTVPPFVGRRVRCTSRVAPGEISYVVEDDGIGFDISALPDPRDSENLLKLNGRGVLLIRTFMDDVAYEDDGRRLVMRKRVLPEPSSAMVG